jgi:hypothetical protein
MRAFTDYDASRNVNPITAEAVDLVQKDVRINHHTIANEVHRMGPEYTTWNKVDAELALVVYYGMPGVIAAGESGHDVHISRKDIDDLPLAFITPLRA